MLFWGLFTPIGQIDSAKIINLSAFDLIFIM